MQRWPPPHLGLRPPPFPSPTPPPMQASWAQVLDPAWEAGHRLLWPRHSLLSPSCCTPETAGHRPPLLPVASLRLLCLLALTQSGPPTSRRALLPPYVPHPQPGAPGRPACVLGFLITVRLPSRIQPWSVPLDCTLLLGESPTSVWRVSARSSPHSL